MKARYRLAKAQIALSEWDAAAQTVDEALAKFASGSGPEAEVNRIELWKLAEEISKSLPAWQWSSAKPEADEQRGATEDFERRLIGFWEYPGGSYEIKLEP